MKTKVRREYLKAREPFEKMIAERALIPPMFWKKIRSEGMSPCWEWSGAKSNDGYGFFKVFGKNIVAHRYIFICIFGTIPWDWQIDHLCRNKSCVNPLHLEAVTQRENMDRSMSISTIHREQTHCKHGHRLSLDNIRLSSKGHRICVACYNRQLEKSKRRYDERKNSSRTGTSNQGGEGVGCSQSGQ